MIQTAQASIIFLNAPGTGDPRLHAAGSAEMACLFAALCVTACAIPVLSACWQPRRLNAADHSCTGNPQTPVGRSGRSEIERSSAVFAVGEVLEHEALPFF